MTHHSSQENSRAVDLRRLLRDRIVIMDQTGAITGKYLSN